MKQIILVITTFIDFTGFAGIGKTVLYSIREITKEYHATTSLNGYFLN